MSEIWVTGLGCISALGPDVASTMAGIRKGTRPQAAPDFFPPEAGANPVCAIPDHWIDHRLFPQNTAWRRSSRDSVVLALQASKEAVCMAGLDHTSLTASVGVALGTTTSSSLHFFTGYANLRKALAQEAALTAQPDFTVFFQSNMAVRVAQELGVKGPTLTISNACTSGADSIGIAAGWLRTGQCEYVLAGGADALCAIPYTGFSRLMIYSTEPCAPFDLNRKGLNLGEAGAVLVLEREKTARQRGAKPLAVLAGYGASSDAHHLTAPHPEARGLKEALRKALAEAGAKPESLAFVNTHGTATRENDKTEGLCYSEELPGVPLWASKGGTGHCLGGAGAIEAILTIMALQQGVIPKSAGCVEPEEAVASTITLEEAPVRKNLALSVSAGFGGSNAALIFKAI